MPRLALRPSKKAALSSCTGEARPEHDPWPDLGCKLSGPCVEGTVAPGRETTPCGPNQGTPSPPPISRNTSTIERVGPDF